MGPFTWPDNPGLIIQGLVIGVVLSLTVLRATRVPPKVLRGNSQFGCFRVYLGDIWDHIVLEIKLGAFAQRKCSVL